jgi:hypothetical protein
MFPVDIMMAGETYCNSTGFCDDDDFRAKRNGHWCRGWRLWTEKARVVKKKRTDGACSFMHLGGEPARRTQAQEEHPRSGSNRAARLDEQLLMAKPHAAMSQLKANF